MKRELVGVLKVTNLHAILFSMQYGSLTISFCSIIQIILDIQSHGKVSFEMKFEYQMSVVLRCSRNMDVTLASGLDKFLNFLQRCLKHVHRRGIRVRLCLRHWPNRN